MQLISNQSLLGVEFQRTYMWDCLLPDITGNDGNSWQGELISPFIQSVSFGQYSMEDVNPIRHGALKAHSAGVFSIQAINMEFLADAQGQVLGYFESWRSLIYDSTNLYYFPKISYVNTGIVTFYDTQGNSLYQWTLVNMFPKSFPAFKMSYEQNEVVKFPIEFSVDFITPNASPAN